MHRSRRLAALWAVLALAAAAVGALAALSEGPPAQGAGDTRSVATVATVTPTPTVAPPPTPTPTRARPARRPRLPRGTDTRAVLRRALLTGAIDRRHWRRWHAALHAAQRAVGTLTGGRRTELASVLGGVEALAAADRLTPSRMPLAFLTLRRNTHAWSLRTLPRPAERMTFGRDPAVFQYFPGHGLQYHALASAGRANALALPCVRAADARRKRAIVRAIRAGAARRVGVAARVVRRRVVRTRCRPRTLARRLDRLVGLSSTRAGFRAWEYRFAYGGGTAPWVSAMTQATAAQALARGASALGEPRYGAAALGALGAFDAPAPVGVARPGVRDGREFVMYSFAPTLRILNGELQAVIGLHDVAEMTGSRRATRLYRLGEATARRAVTDFDTGAWSRYSLAGAESTLSYHRLVTGFLAGLCTRTGRSAYCDPAARFTRYLHEPPRIDLDARRRLREGRPTGFDVSLSKVSQTRVTVTTRRRLVLVRTATLARGRYGFAFVPPRPGRYRIRVSAVGPEGRRAVVHETSRAEPKPRPKPKPKPRRRIRDQASSFSGLAIAP